MERERDWDAKMAAAWARFAEKYRRIPAPAALRKRVLAALAAERAALGGEAARQRDGRGPDQPGADITDVKLS